MCSNDLRDGKVNDIIPDKHALCKNKNCVLDNSFGMHEDFYHYHHCRARTRNIRLFKADQVVS